MREFGKSRKLDNVLYDVRGPVVDEAARMEENGTNVLKLNIGNPAPFGFRTPDEVIYDMSRQLTDCEGYSNSKGLFSARKAIMQYAQLKKLPNVTVEDIYTGNGVSELINLSMSALLDNGDEVLVPAPDYPLWTACVTLAGGTAVHYICDEQSEWYPDIEDIKKKITDKTKAIVIINPNNPTGALYPREVLQQIVDVAREHELMTYGESLIHNTQYQSYDKSMDKMLEAIDYDPDTTDIYLYDDGGVFICGNVPLYYLSWDKTKHKRVFYQNENTKQMNDYYLIFDLDEKGDELLKNGGLKEKAVFVVTTYYVNKSVNVDFSMKVLSRYYDISERKNASTYQGGIYYYELTLKK